MLIKTTKILVLLLMSTILIACVPQGAPINSSAPIQAPDFTLDNALGGQTSLSDYAGTPVLLFFHMAVG